MLTMRKKKPTAPARQNSQTASSRESDCGIPAVETSESHLAAVNAATVDAAAKAAITTIEAEIQWRLKDFLEEASAGDKMFLCEALRWWDSLGTPKPGELIIPAAFEWTLKHQQIACFEEKHGKEIAAFWQRFHQNADSVEGDALKFLDTADEPCKQVLQSFLNTSPHEITARIKHVLNAIATHKGCINAAEEFILNAILWYGKGNYTPGDASDQVKDFQDNFNDQVQIARHMNAHFPDLGQ